MNKREELMIFGRILAGVLVMAVMTLAVLP